MTTVRDLKCVFVGDGAVGKSEIISSFFRGPMIGAFDYVPTVFDSYSSTLFLRPPHDSVEISLTVWDTAGQEDYDELRCLAYPDADVVVIVFSVVGPQSFANVRLRWFEEIQRHLPGVPLLLVGSKTDLRGHEEQEDQAQHLPTPEDGESEAQRMHAMGYYECSSVTQEGFPLLFQDMIRAGLRGIRRLRGFLRRLFRKQTPDPLSKTVQLLSSEGFRHSCSIQVEPGVGFVCRGLPKDWVAIFMDAGGAGEDPPPVEEEFVHSREFPLPEPKRGR